MKNTITIQIRRDNGKVRYGGCGAEERPSKLPHFLRRRRAEQARRQAAMDQYTLGECLHLHYVLGWTAEIRAGHLVFLGRVPEEAGKRKKAGRRPSFRVLVHLSAGRKNPGREKGSAGTTCHESTACQKAPCYYSRADRL